MPSPYTNYSESDDIYNKLSGREVSEEEVQDNLEDIDDSDDILALDDEDEDNFEMDELEDDDYMDDEGNQDYERDEFPDSDMDIYWESTDRD